MPYIWASTTRDSNQAKRDRVKKYLKRPNAREESNRFIARKLGVDEKMIRFWKKKMKIPALSRYKGQPRKRVRTVRTKS